jgi:hypothetical protein
MSGQTALSQNSPFWGQRGARVCVGAQCNQLNAVTPAGYGQPFVALVRKDSIPTLSTPGHAE